VTIVPAPFLAISKAPSGTFTQGQTAVWDITVTNTAAGTSQTSCTVTVVDTLPTGYTFASNTGTGWTCGAITVTVTCTSTTAVAGGTSFPILAITVNVPSTSPVSVTNNAVAFGGGDLTHTSIGSAATSFSTVTVVQVAATINITSGNNQSVTVGSALPTNLAVTVLDAGGVAINGATVTFTAPPTTGASGTFAGGTNVKTATTNSSGLATATVFTTNFVAGSYSISAAAGSISTNFSVTNNPGPASIMTANAGTTPQSALVNAAFANALAVTVTDSHNNPVSGVVIQFTAPGSGASGLFSNSTIQFQPMTNSSGVATAPFTANSTSGGPYSVTAGAPGLTQVSFSLTNLAGSASSMTANAGTTPQTVTVGNAFTQLAVTVQDSLHNPISGVNVTFTAPGSGASGTFSNSTAMITVATNSSGVASAQFTSNTKAGSYSVTASAAGVTSVGFTLTNNPGPATIMTANAGTTPQSAAINTAFGNALAVTVTDSHNNPVSGVVIQFTAPSSGASGLFSNSTIQFEPMTNASGVATAPFTANGTAGGYSVTAGAPGLTQVSFSLTNLTGGAASVTPSSGTTPQAATVNTTFAAALAVTVRDAGSNPISGANVVFTAPSTGASGTFSNATNTITVATNGSGIASAPFTANGTSGGPYSVTAMVGGVGTFFSLTNNAIVQVSPTVVSYKVLWGSQSYNVIGSPRNRLPWQITGIQVVFSEPITTGDVNSLSGPGITTTGFSGLGTTTLTWTISPIALGNFPTVLAATGADALKDMNGNALANGTSYNQNLKILYGDFNDDGNVNAQDTVGVNNAISSPYNIFADMNGDGVINIADVQIVRARSGTSLP